MSTDFSEAQMDFSQVVEACQGLLIEVGCTTAQLQVLYKSV